MTEYSSWPKFPMTLRIQIRKTHFWVMNWPLVLKIKFGLSKKK